MSAEEAKVEVTEETKVETTEETKNEEVGEGVEVLQGDWILPEVKNLVKEDVHTTGEEDEEVFWSHRSKLYRYVDGEWKERGLGDSKLLQHKQTKKIRFLLRQEKTLKIVSNHYIVSRGPLCKLTTNAGNDKIYVWTAADFAEDEPVTEQFGLRFKEASDAAEFRDKFNEAVAINDDLFPHEEENNSEEESSEKENKKEE